MVAQIFNDIAAFEIRVSWTSITTGYVNGVRFSVEDEIVTFPNHPTFNDDNVKPNTRNLVINLRRAVHLTPEFSDAKRESKSLYLNVQNGNFPGVYSVHNPLNGSLYDVVLNSTATYCNCKDNQFRNTECKHIRAVKRHIEKASQPPLKIPSWYQASKKPFYRVVTDISEAEIAQAKADLGW